MSPSHLGAAPIYVMNGNMYVQATAVHTLFYATRARLVSVRTLSGEASCLSRNYGAPLVEELTRTLGRNSPGASEAAR